MPTIKEKQIRVCPTILSTYSLNKKQHVLCIIVIPSAILRPAAWVQTLALALILLYVTLGE